MSIEQPRVAPGLPEAPHRRFVEHSAPRVIADTVSRAGLYADEPENCRRSLGNFARIFAHFALIYLVFEEYKLEGRALRLVTQTALAALPIHYMLPFRWKQPFFIAASIAALVLVFGPQAALAVVLGTLVLVGLASLPIAWGARVALVTTAGVALGLGRAGLLPIPLPTLAWPILGSICMFRIAIYLYELKHAKKREHLFDVLSYFFLLPNFAFPFFPVVDYRTLRRGYFGADITETQRAGLRLLVRGITHLLIWKLFYYYYADLSKPSNVHDLPTLAAFLVHNYLLYLRVSGLFHLACGMLHLFGYRLPETHHHYLLASSFTDYWRRINIYWKDFMVKLVFNPVAFHFKRAPQAVSLSIATVAVFFVTWAAHGYQSFWLRGEWGFSLQDSLFWAILGGLVLINVQCDLRTARAGRLRRPPFWSRSTLIHACKVLATFATITVLWSLWTSPGLGEWLDLMRRGFH